MSWIFLLDARVREVGQNELSAASGWFYVAETSSRETRIIFESFAS